MDEYFPELRKENTYVKLNIPAKYEDLINSLVSKFNKTEEEKIKLN